MLDPRNAFGTGRAIEDPYDDDAGPTHHRVPGPATDGVILPLPTCRARAPHLLPAMSQPRWGTAAPVAHSRALRCMRVGCGRCSAVAVYRPPAGVPCPEGF